MVAIILGIRDGMHDAEAGRPPLIWGLIFHPEGRRRDLKRTVQSLWKAVVLATILDAIAQYLMFRAVYLGAAILVGTCIMAVPYFLARALANRVASSGRRGIPRGKRAGA
jgi:hypothetical protein